MKSSGKAFTGSIVMSMILIVGIVSLVAADSPVFPMGFQGTLTIDGLPASAGTQMKGLANGIDKTFEGPYTTASAGSYGNPPFDLFKVDCQDGDIVTFSVEVSPSVFELADQTAICERSTDVQLDLTVGESQGDCTPGNTRPCGTDTGECEYGTETCSPEGEWGACEGGVGPTDELCDGLDNDCDGQTDEDFPDLGDQCTAGIGACEASGEMVCTVDGTGTECNAVPGDPSPEECNNIDDDCNGLVDDEITPRSCGVSDVGICTFGIETCEAGDWVGCTAVFPEQEVCDNELDDDCDGYTDCADEEDCSDDPACVEPDEFCIQILSIKVLNNNFIEDYYIMSGEMYSVEVVNYNSCEDPVESMQIVQINQDGTTPINIGTVKSTIAPYSTSTVTVGFVLPGVGLGTEFVAEAYNWNHWISQDPGTWEAYSAPASVGFEAGTGPI